MCQNVQLDPTKMAEKPFYEVKRVEIKYAAFFTKLNPITPCFELSIEILYIIIAQGAA